MTATKDAGRAKLDTEKEPVPIPNEVTDEQTAAPEGIGSRLRQPHTIVSFVLALAIVLFFVRRLDVEPREVWRNMRNANLALYGLAILLYYSSFVLRSIRWRWMLDQAGLNADRGHPVPSTRSTLEILLLSWFVNCLVPAKLGDAYRGYLLKRTNGAPISRSIGTILAERLTDLCVLFATMAVAGLMAFRGHMPSEATRTLLIGSVLLVIGAVAITGLWFARDLIERRLPDRFREQFSHLHEAIFLCLRSPLRPVGISAGIWALDALRFYCVASSVSGNISLSTAAFVALMSALLTTLPVTPAGLGVVEVAMISVLKIVDVNASLAGSIALMDRLITYWSLVAVGIVLYIHRLRRDVRG
jgi:uncharacterized protein (TIRG00374 family)